MRVKDLRMRNPKSNVIPGKGESLVLGDNREVSKDSRVRLASLMNQIVGKVSFRFWPFSDSKHDL